MTNWRGMAAREGMTEQARKIAKAEMTNRRGVMTKKVSLLM